MHHTNYRPTRSQQLILKGLIRKRNESEEVIIHHVLEDSFLKLHIQIERRLKIDNMWKISFERIALL